jgi:hypothetical protein
VESVTHSKSALVRERSVVRALCTIVAMHGGEEDKM